MSCTLVEVVTGEWVIWFIVTSWCNTKASIRRCRLLEAVDMPRQRECSCTIVTPQKHQVHSYEALSFYFTGTRVSSHLMCVQLTLCVEIYRCFLCWYTTGQTTEISDVKLGAIPWVYLQLHFTSVNPGGNTMYRVLNFHRLCILSTRYIRVILTTNSIISRLVLVLRKRCVLSLYTLKSPVAFKGCAVAQAVCRRPLPTKTWVRLCPWENGEQTGTGTEFFAPLGFPLSVSIHQCCILIFWSESEAVGTSTDQCCFWHPGALQ